MKKNYCEECGHYASDQPYVQCLGGGEASCDCDCHDEEEESK